MRTLTVIFAFIGMLTLAACQTLTFQGDTSVVFSKGRAGGFYELLGGQAQYCKMVISGDSDYKITEADIAYLKDGYCAEFEQLVLDALRTE